MIPWMTLQWPAERREACSQVVYCNRLQYEMVYDVYRTLPIEHCIKLHNGGGRGDLMVSMMIWNQIYLRERRTTRVVATWVDPEQDSVSTPSL
jgi:hypothetical protein